MADRLVYGEEALIGVVRWFRNRLHSPQAQLRSCLLKNARKPSRSPQHHRKQSTHEISATIKNKSGMRLAQYSYFPSIQKPVIAAINGPAVGLGFIRSWAAL